MRRRLSFPPCVWRRLNATMAAGWLVLTPVAFWLGWLHSVTFVSALSLVALSLANLAAWRADVPTEPQPAGGRVKPCDPPVSA